jgi:hypothetical protein
MPMCAKCGSASFEAVPAVPKGCTREVLFIQCESCRAVAGVLDARDTEAMLKALEEMAAKTADRRDVSI